MTRYITTFNENGIIADDREAADPVSAVRAYLTDVHESDEVEEIERHTIRNTNLSGLIVWTVPANFPNVNDGTDQSLIELLDIEGIFVGAFRQSEDFFRQSEDFS